VATGGRANDDIWHRLKHATCDARGKVLSGFVCPDGRGGDRRNSVAVVAAGASMPLWRGLCGMPG
jgi:hypothetical protein